MMSTTDEAWLNLRGVLKGAERGGFLFFLLLKELPQRKELSHNLFLHTTECWDWSLVKCTGLHKGASVFRLANLENFELATGASSTSVGTVTTGR